MVSISSSIDIENETDILRLEDMIRRALQCQGTVCAFLESLPYRIIRRSLLQRLNNIISHDAYIVAYAQQYVAVHVQDARRVTLRVIACSDCDADAPKPSTNKATKKRALDSSCDDIAATPSTTKATKKRDLDSTRDTYMRSVQAKRSSDRSVRSPIASSPPEKK